MTATDRERQMREAEELLGTEVIPSFARGLFWGRFEAALALPYPQPAPAETASQEEFLGRVRDFLDREVDPAAIDREARVPDSVLDGLFGLGVMSMSIPRQYGGGGFSQYTYCKVIEAVGAVDASLAVLINAHQSIGLNSLVLFGTPEQQARWLPRLIEGKQLAAFALTEPNAGSDAGGIETRALPSDDGSHYVLNGRKQWITNGGCAGLLTVMAKVPGARDEKGRERVTAFLVTPDMPGFEVVDPRLEKCGIRGTATAKLAFHDVRVPVENIIGPPGKGLKVALTLLDFGRITFGATCTGVARRCLADTVRHVRERHQFGRPLAEFELVKRKVADMAARAYAIEAGTYLTAGMMDRGLDDYMLETAILKVYASEALWEIVNDTIQLFGGRAYFTDQPYERMMRDARINMIGEGANDVLRHFIAMVGMRDVGLSLKGLLDSLKSPVEGIGKLAGFAKRHLPGKDGVTVPLRHRELAEHGQALAELIRTLGHTVEAQLIRHREEILERQYVQARIADAAIEIYMMAAVLARLDTALDGPGGPLGGARELPVGAYFCRGADRRARRHLRELGDNLDTETTAAAEAALSSV